VVKWVWMCRCRRRVSAKIGNNCYGGGVNSGRVGVVLGGKTRGWGVLVGGGGGLCSKREKRTTKAKRGPGCVAGEVKPGARQGAVCGSGGGVGGGGGCGGRARGGEGEWGQRHEGVG